MALQILNESRPPTADRRSLSAPPALRRFPYPYRAMLAICSDLDETADATVYREQMRFLNTCEPTSMGDGVGLEVGNTIYFDMPRAQFAYWNTDDDGRAMVRSLISSGHIDCLHSFGDLATTRAHAGRALDELTRHGLSLKVWIDHATAPTNFGADIMQGHGDEVGHAAYHADLTLGYGVDYVWRGRVTSVIGQGEPIKALGCRPRCHPASSLRSIAKETAKQLLGRLGNAKYAFHATNRVCVSATLRDAQSVIEFLRCNPHPRGLDCGDTANGFAEVLTSEFLNRLVDQEGCCVLYTHLGKLRGGSFSRDAGKAFQLLSTYQRNGKILVTTTRRLLDYQRTIQRITVRVSTDRGRSVIHLTTADKSGLPISRAELAGLTFYITDPHDTTVRVDGFDAPDLILNTPDETGFSSISFPWKALSFPV